MNLFKHAVSTAIMLLLALFTFAQKTTITGKITEASSGAAIAGATIKVRSTGVTTVTKNDGSFSVEAEKNDVLEINSLSYTSQTVNVDGRTEVNVSLASSVQDLGQVVVVGSRGSGRIKTETAVPVDVISLKDASQTTAKADLSSLLNATAPSFNYNKQSGGDGADAIDLATLRGLGPDQTLVLINGKRQHQTAFVALFGTRGRGNSGTDLNAIPEASIDRVEILRDGASAQYGSDAIAGVINIILKKDIKHLTINTGWSGYDDAKYNTLNAVDQSQYPTGSTIDGQTFNLGLNYGLPIGKNKGFLNFSGNFLTQGKTFRQVPDTNITTNPDALPVNTVRRANGDASVTSGGAMINSEIPIAGTNTTFYTFGGYNYKNSNAYAYSRNFSAVPQKYPTDDQGNIIFVPGIMHNTSDGDVYFNPLEDVHITDASLSTGFKGTTKSEWSWDASNTIGGNNFHYFGEKTFNASIGGQQSADITNFDDGGFSLIQNTTDLDINKHYKNVAEGMTLAFGAEYRYEKYHIYQGEPASWKNYGTYFVAGGDTTFKAGGAQGFPGFQPADEVNNDISHRSNIAGYAEAEIDITKKWLVDGALRLENYSDFGFVNTYKFATRYKVTHNFNLRGSVSTGFRAPSLQQIYFSNTESNVSAAGGLTLVKIAPNNSPITKAAGIPALKQEKSVNASFGFSWKPVKNLSITMDGYMVKIKDRVVLTSQFDNSVAAIAPILTQLNVDDAQFFANAVNTTNWGLDIVVDYTKKWGDQHFKALLAGNLQKMTIDKINIPAALDDSYDHQQTFFSDREQAFVKASAPPQKFSLNLEYGKDKISVGTHFTYFGKIVLYGYGYNTAYPPTVTLDADPNTVVPEQFNYEGKVVSDLYVSYKLCKAATLFLGADNLFNVHPSLGVVPGARLSAYDNEPAGPWDEVQMGFDGVRLFGKVALNF